MITSDWDIARARWRDPSLDDDRERDAVGASLPDDGPDDDTYTLHLPGLRQRDTCLTPNNPSHDFDRCVIDPNPGGLSARMQPSTLFLREEGDKHRISPSDVQQRAVGDCHLLAPLAAMASTALGRKAIRDAITPLTNEQGAVVAYSVKLHRANPGTPRTFTETSYVVAANTPYVVGHAQARSQDGTYEIWPLVMEKAYAQARGGYNVIGKKTPVGESMEALTGRAVTHLDAAAFHEGLLRDPHAVLVFSSRHGIEPNEYGLKADHAYAVTSRIVGGRKVLELYNPWGREQPRPVPIAKLGDYFSSLDVGTVGGAP